MKRFILTLLVIALAIVFHTIAAQAAMVTLAWDANDPAPDGYRLYQRTGGSYDYTQPIWQGAVTTCTLEVPDDVESAFVVRAFVVGGLTGKMVESGDSNEVSYIKPPVRPQNLIIEAIDQIITGLKTLRQAVAAGL